MFKPATRTGCKARVLLSGPSTSGKTYSSLLFARGLAGPDGRIAVIDTEDNAAGLYEGLTDYDVAVVGAPFLTEKYTQAIDAAEKAGYDVLIIDSLSHQWDGPGGILDRKDTGNQGRGGE